MEKPRLMRWKPVLLVIVKKTKGPRNRAFRLKKFVEGFMKFY